MQPSLSVVIPTRHRNELLAQCLDQLKSGTQTLSADHYEVIVTDDGCETTAEEMIRSHYPWVRWVAGPRRGPAANRNNGARLAQGEWLVFTDDDCVPDAQWLQAYMEAIAPGIAVYEGKTTCKAGISSPLDHAPVNLTGGYLWSCNMMIHKLVFQSLNGFDEHFPYPHLEDVDLNDRIKYNTQAIAFVERAIIDHPPKRLPWGVQIGKLHESDIYYFQKNNLNFSRIELILYVTKARLTAIRQYRIQKDSFLALISLFIESVYVLQKLESWERKYSNKS